MLRTGKLQTVKALVERYVHKIVVGGDQIEVQFNLNMNSRVVAYPANPHKKEIPRSSRQEEPGVFTSKPNKMLAAHGADGGNRTRNLSLGS